MSNPRITFWSLPLFLLVQMALPGSGLAALDAADIYELAEEAVFQVRVVNKETGKKSSIGSGFLYGRGDRLATNYHVVSGYIEKPDTYTLRYLATDGREGRLRLLAVDAVHDLALVEADDPLGQPLPIGPLPAKGASLYATGNPLDLGLTLAAGNNGGELVQTDGSRILFSGSLNPGMSGGPTFDDQGQVVGINVATARNDISFIVPTRYLAALSREQQPADGLLDTIAGQIRDYQVGYLDSITAGDWPSTTLRDLRIPGAVSPTIRCWDASPKPEPEHLYRRLSISCKNENEIYLTDKLEVGKILYEFIWVESEQLGPLRFNRLYQALNSSQFGGRAGEDEVGRFRCENRFVDVNGITFKATLCARPYKQYPGLSDVLFTAAMVGRKDRGFIFNLDLYGTELDAATELVTRFLGDIAWHN